MFRSRREGRGICPSTSLDLAETNASSPATSSGTLAGFLVSRNSEVIARFTRVKPSSVKR